MVVAIDGPAGVGKSSTARALAQRLGFTYLDSGAMYRSVALASLQRNADPAEVAGELQIEVGDRILLDGHDVSDAIRTPAVSEQASRAASDPRVRAAMVAKQRRLLSDGDWVAEGRDIGTVVAPDAEVKVFLTASSRGPRAAARRRARRRPRDRPHRTGDPRPARHAAREHSPLRPADGADVLDTTDLTLDEVVERVLELVRAARA